VVELVSGLDAGKAGHDRVALICLLLRYSIRPMLCCLICSELQVPVLLEQSCISASAATAVSTGVCGSGFVPAVGLPALVFAEVGCLVGA